jgi:ribosomal protein S1
MEYGGSDAPPEVITWHDRVKVQVVRMDEARRRLNELRLMRDEEKRSE